MRERIVHLGAGAEAAHELLARLFDADAVQEALDCVHRAARRCGWDEARGDVFAWAGRMVGHYRNLAAAPSP